jgi:quercetin dioxygenase-like cupin family protein
MKVFHFAEVPAKSSTLAPGATMIRQIIGEPGEAAHFVMRVVDLLPGQATPLHAHWWEHGLYILAGQGRVRTPETEYPVSEGCVVYVPGNETHQFVNDGDEPLRYICVVPSSELEGWEQNKMQGALQ